jgi:transposase
MVELVRAGHDPADLAREFEPSAQAIRNWVAEADRREGRREGAKPAPVDAAPTAAEREELARLRRENKQLRLERDILSQAAAWIAPRPARSRSGSSVHEREPGRIPDRHHGARARRVGGWLPRLAASPAPTPVESRMPGIGATDAWIPVDGVAAPWRSVGMVVAAGAAPAR